MSAELPNVAQGGSLRRRLSIVNLSLDEKDAQAQNSLSPSSGPLSPSSKKLTPSSAEESFEDLPRRRRSSAALDKNQTRNMIRRIRNTSNLLGSVTAIVPWPQQVFLSSHQLLLTHICAAERWQRHLLLTSAARYLLSALLRAADPPSPSMSAMSAAHAHAMLCPDIACGATRALRFFRRLLARQTSPTTIFQVSFPIFATPVEESPLKLTKCDTCTQPRFTPAPCSACDPSCVTLRL
eukprot:1226589-Rhodomonas_salina.1